MIYSVKVKEDYRWKQAQVAGQIFTKEAVEVADPGDEVINSPILDVKKVTAKVTPKAKPEPVKKDSKPDADKNG